MWVPNLEIVKSLHQRITRLLFWIKHHRTIILFTITGDIPFFIFYYFSVLKKHAKPKKRKKVKKKSIPCCPTIINIALLKKLDAEIPSPPPPKICHSITLCYAKKLHAIEKNQQSIEKKTEKIKSKKKKKPKVHVYRGLIVVNGTRVD